MSDPITLTYTASTALTRAGMAACWRHLAQPTGRLVSILVSLLVAVALVGLSHVLTRALGFPPGGYVLVLAGTLLGYLGATFLIFRQQRRIAASATARAQTDGPTTATLGPDGARFDTANVQRFYRWAAIDGTFTMQGGLGLRTGGIFYPIPTSALPDGLTREALIAQIDAWRGA